MKLFYEIALWNAAAATVLAVLAACVARTCRRPALVHALWVIVLLKLVTPPFFRIPIPWLPDVSRSARNGPALSPIGEELAVAAVGTVPERLEPITNPDDRSLDRMPDATLSVGRSETAGSVVGLPRSVPSSESTSRPIVARLDGLSWSARGAMSAWVIVWAAGSALWFGLIAMRVVRFRRMLRCARSVPRELETQVGRLARSMGLRRCPKVWLVPGHLSPMLWGIGPKACLVLPEKLLRMLDDGQTATLLAHELAHLKRGDHWVRLIELLATGLYWWHPVVWWARSQIQQAEETCCDAWVVGEFPGSARKYAQTLLDTLDFLAGVRPVMPPVASGICHVQAIRLRLTLIMRGTTPKALSAAGRLGVLTIAAVLLPLLPSPAAPDAKTFPEPMSARMLDDAESRPMSTWEISGVQPNAAMAESQAAMKSSSDQDSGDPAPDVWAVAQSPDGTKTLQAGVNRTLAFIDANTGRRIDLSTRNITSVAFAPGGKTFVTGGWDGAARLWDARTGQELAALVGHGDAVTSVAFAPDGLTLATASLDRTVKLWDVHDRRELQTVPARSLPVHCVRFSPDGTLLAAATGNWKTVEPGQVALWNLATLAEEVSFDCLSGVGAISFSTDGQMVATGEWNGRVTLWDVTARRPVETFWVHKDVISSEAFSPNSRTALRNASRESHASWPLDRVHPSAPRFSGGSVSVSSASDIGTTGVRARQNFVGMETDGEWDGGR